MDKNTAPKGYKLVKDAQIGGYVPPAGFRLVREEPRRRMRPSTGQGRGIKAGSEYRAALDACIRRMREVEGRGEAGVGEFVAYANTSAQPSLLAEMFGMDRRWAFIPSRGGYIRLAAEESDPSKPLLSFRPGEFVGCTARGRVPGFATVQHPGFDTPRIRVAMPADGVPPIAKPPVEDSGRWPSPERADLLARVKELVSGECPNRDEVLEWAAGATAAELRQWIESDGGGK